MNNIRLPFLSVLLFCLFAVSASAQIRIDNSEEWGADLDSLRNMERLKEDTVIYNASYIRYTTLDRMKLGTYTVPLDTTLTGFQYFNPQYDPHNPTINTGNYGLASRDLLFNPKKSIGFQTGFHSLERYLLRPDSIRYYRNRAPYSELYFVSGDQVFKAQLARNITPLWSIGGEVNYALSQGFYQNQRYNNAKTALYSWYESKNHRYNLLANLVFNNLVATENGSVLNDTLFRDPERLDSESQLVKLRGQREERPRQTWIDHGLYVRQSLFMGRIDTINAGELDQQILPTQRLSHALHYRSQKFKFYKNEDDLNGAFPFSQNILTNDSTLLRTISNEFGYSFYLRGKSVGFIKNEVKLDLRLLHEFHWYKQMGDNKTFQNTTLKAGVGYRFSDRVFFTGDLNQIVEGANFGDYLYEGVADIRLSNSIGSIQLGAFTQNKSPEYLFERVNYQYNQWNRNFNKTKTHQLSFGYKNPKLGFRAKVEYNILTGYLYYKEVDNPDNDPLLLRQIEPAQMNSSINLLKLSVGQKFKFGRFTFDNFAVYQKTDYMATLQTPELYTWHSFYYNTSVVKVINMNLGFDVRFNTPFPSPSYDINTSQFYKDNANIEFSTYPVVDLWMTATLKRTNFFLRYDYANQGLQSRGYYTVRRYPMPDANLRFGISWKFYD